jgi:NAD(P)H-dependent FMN reductase
MPLYDGDYESANGIPDSAKKIKQLFMTHDALLISSPEYNSSFSALLKNTIDWVSRKEAGEQPLQCFQGKVAALISASPGALGGLRGLFQLRQLLSNLNVLVIPQQVTISGADKVLVDGTINDPKKLDAISDLAKKLVKITSALKA